ncbi:MAG: hypothetical protein L0H93_06500, partial [Nocardioides sp.]|nr:hypothetical protein [Nocardioides sp.]
MSTTTTRYREGIPGVEAESSIWSRIFGSSAASSSGRRKVAIPTTTSVGDRIIASFAGPDGREIRGRLRPVGS